MDNAVQLAVAAVALDSQNGSPVILLKHKSLYVPVPAAPAEASALVLVREGLEPVRPLTHDIILEFLGRHGFVLAYLEIHVKYENEWRSRLHYSQGGQSFTMEVRPSDGIVLASKSGIPILMLRELFDREKHSLESESELKSGYADLVFFRDDYRCFEAELPTD